MRIRARACGHVWCPCLHGYVSRFSSYRLDSSYEWFDDWDDGEEEKEKKTKTRIACRREGSGDCSVETEVPTTEMSNLFIDLLGGKFFFSSHGRQRE